MFQCSSRCNSDMRSSMISRESDNTNVIASTPVVKLLLWDNIYPFMQVWKICNQEYKFSVYRKQIYLVVILKQKVKMLIKMYVQVVSLVEQKKFYGSVIQRELALISNLFTDDNFPNITRYKSEGLEKTYFMATQSIRTSKALKMKK